MSSQKSRRRQVLPLSALLCACAMAACTGGTEFLQTTFHPVSEYGALQNAVFLNTFWWTMAILALVILLIIIVVIRFRERPGAPVPRQIHGNTRLEILWTLIPGIIVIFIGIPTVQAIFATQTRPPEGALTIEVEGHQWWWEIRYPTLRVTTANLFYLPVGKDIHLRLHSEDVVHSFWIPRLGGKRDVNPLPREAEGEMARYNHIVLRVDEPGTYSGQCAEFCGVSHALMAITAVAVSQTEFDAWVESMRHVPPDTAQAAGVPPTDPAVAEGKAIFLGRACVACHAISNTTAQGKVGPDLTRFGLRPTVGAGARPNTLENVQAWIRNPRDLKAGTLMPGATVGASGFPPTGLTDAEIAAVAAYLLSLK